MNKSDHRTTREAGGTHSILVEVRNGSGIIRLLHEEGSTSNSTNSSTTSINKIDLKSDSDSGDNDNDNSTAATNNGALSPEISRKSTRLMHLVGLMPVTRPSQNVLTPLEARVYYIAGGYMALKHFNERSANGIIPDLVKKLDGCDIQLTIEYRDTQYSRIEGARHLGDILQKFPENSIESPLPTAIVGAGRSDVSATISTLSGMFELPQVSPHSSAATLDNKARYPYLARTTPSNEADGKAAVDYLKHLDVTHLGVIHTLDANGIAYDATIQRETRLLDMSTVSASYRYNAGEDNIRQALKKIRSHGVRYIFAVIEPSTWKSFIRLAIDEKLIGQPGYVWIFHSGMIGLVAEELDREKEYDIARAIHGSGVLLKDVPSNKPFDDELLILENDTDQQQDFIDKWVNPEMFDGFSFRHPGPNYPQYINYDTVMALGFAACAIDHNFFSGKELYQSLLKTKFQGASDYVSFDNETGSRDSFPFRVDNILMEDRGNNTLGFVLSPTAKVTVAGINDINAFRYWDNTTNVPLRLPAPNENLHLIPKGIRVAGLTLSAVAMILSLICAVWTCYNRNRTVVKAAQPFFLYQLCIGALIMVSSTIIPMSLQEPISQGRLDIACMSVPWLFLSGYSISSAALFSKCWRVNTLFEKGAKFRRVQVRIVDAIFPLIIFTSVNIVLLTVWTILAPVSWTRVPDTADFDEFGRSTSSYGSCGTDGSVKSKIIQSIIGIVNVLGLIFANYQCFKTRALPTAFDESYYVALSNATLLESLFLGIPVLILVDKSPSAHFIVESILVTVICLCILLPVFFPKVISQRITHTDVPSKYMTKSTGDGSRSSTQLRLMVAPG